MSTSNNPSETAESIVIIGAYGLIGFGIATRLVADGYHVTGLGRNAETANRVLPNIPWIVKDIRTLCEAENWCSILNNISVVVNCSGALQDGPEDDLEAIHNHAVSALATACHSAGVGLIQISAVGARPDASTPFLSSKGRGDAAIRASGVAYHILRPGLVLASHAYGGTAMLRMLATVPVIQPIAMPKAQIQTVSLADVERVVSAAIDGKIPPGYECDLVEAELHSLREVVASVRYWLGFGKASLEIRVPNLLLGAICNIADAISLLGWRSPLRTTAFKILTQGVKGDPGDLTRFGLPPVLTMSQTLATFHATAEDRLFARMSLLTPIIIVTLCLFWFASGAIGLARAQEAANVLETAGWSSGLAVSSVVFWAVIDIAIAGAFAYRKFTKSACWAAILVSCFYLAASTLFVPGLWIDPLGPLIKVAPGIILALVARAAMETR